MAVREFDGTDDTIVHAIDALSGMTFGTAACIFKPTTTTSNVQICDLHNSGNSLRVILLSYTTSGVNRVIMHNPSTGDSNPADDSITSGEWALAIVRKATGTATPRFSIYNFTDDIWTHSAGSSALPDWTAPGAGGFVRTDVETALEFFKGRMAVSAVWSNEVHWSADSTGDTAIEAAGLETSLQNWVDEAPDALWAFNQASTATAVDDLINNSDQTSLTGTTVINGDDPPGFSFSLGPGPPVPDLYVVTSNLQLR